MADALDFLRNAEWHKRISPPVAGANLILWEAKDLPTLHDGYMSARYEQLIQAAQPAIVKAVDPAIDKAALAKMGFELRDFGPKDLSFIGRPTCGVTVDHANDLVESPGVDWSLFEKNSPVLDSHNSAIPPVATSAMPFMSGNSHLAIFRFPNLGVSENSDSKAAAVRARLMRGLSIGFIPKRWSFSKDPNRPLGINFHEIKCIEFSLCSVPMNPSCRVLGAVANNQSAPSDGKTADRLREARQLASKARSIIASIPDPVPLTRDERLAEARNLKRAAELAARS
jgi:hypothetical protein